MNRADTLVERCDKAPAGTWVAFALEELSTMRAKNHDERAAWAGLLCDVIDYVYAAELDALDAMRMAEHFLKIEERDERSLVVRRWSVIVGLVVARGTLWAYQRSDDDDERLDALAMFADYANEDYTGALSEKFLHE
jgi:hypothetical protein